MEEKRMLIYEVRKINDVYYTQQKPLLENDMLEIWEFSVEQPDGITCDRDEDVIHIDNEYVTLGWYYTRDLIIRQDGIFYLAYDGDNGEEVMERLEEFYANNLYTDNESIK